MPIFEAYFCKKRGQWRIHGYGRDICGAVNEAVARETAALMNVARMENLP